MTRKEQAKIECGFNVLEGDMFETIFHKGIERGVEWADSHIDWHKGSPLNENLMQHYWVMFGDIEKFYFKHALFITNAFIDDDGNEIEDIIKWIELPSNI